MLPRALPGRAPLRHLLAGPHLRAPRPLAPQREGHGGREAPRLFLPHGPLPLCGPPAECHDSGCGLPLPGQLRLEDVLGALRLARVHHLPGSLQGPAGHARLPFLHERHGAVRAGVGGHPCGLALGLHRSQVVQRGGRQEAGQRPSDLVGHGRRLRLSRGAALVVALLARAEVRQAPRAHARDVRGGLQEDPLLLVLGQPRALPPLAVHPP
mmetsp:Transcript_136499/g.424120  ORF Transcript_136499/g.424120 Transcript_136499/m.424120 type:complete len:211 (-) Transcript_136499:383-1015(-)